MVGLAIDRADYWNQQPLALRGTAVLGSHVRLPRSVPLGLLNGVQSEYQLRTLLFQHLESCHLLF